MASPSVRRDDPQVDNSQISYAKCVRGHVLKDAKDWIFCENLPAADSLCWQEGGRTLLTVTSKKAEK